MIQLALIQLVTQTAIDLEARQVRPGYYSKDAAMTVLVINSYLEDAPQLLQVRSIAANKGNAVALLDRTYTFQSSSAKLGALKLYKLSQAPKDMSKHGTIKAALKLVFQLEVEDNRVEVTLNTQRQRYQG